MIATKKVTIGMAAKFIYFLLVTDVYHKYIYQNMPIDRFLLNSLYT